jgi:hypothetical protein
MDEMERLKREALNAVGSAPKKPASIPQQPVSTPTVELAKKDFITTLRLLPVWAKVFVCIGCWFVGMMIIGMFAGKNERIAMPIFMLFIVIFPFIFYRIAAKKKRMRIECPNCKYQGFGQYITKGSFAIELILWFFLILPGLIYSIWRLSSRRWACPQCDFDHVVKLGIVETTE